MPTLASIATALLAASAPSAAGCAQPHPGAGGGAASSSSTVGVLHDSGVRQGETFSTALPIRYDTSQSGQLAGPQSKDFYRFSAKKGDRVLVWTKTNGSSAAVADTSAILDTVVTLFAAGAPDTPIAQDDNGWPDLSTDSQLFAQLPDDGDYVFVVQDCNGVFPTGCPNPAAGLKDFAYQVAVTNLSGIEINAGKSQDGTLANAVEIPFVPAKTAGDYQVA